MTIAIIAHHKHNSININSWHRPEYNLVIVNKIWRPPPKANQLGIKIRPMGIPNHKQNQIFERNNNIIQNHAFLVWHQGAPAVTVHPAEQVNPGNGQNHRAKYFVDHLEHFLLVSGLDFAINIVGFEDPFYEDEKYYYMPS